MTAALVETLKMIKVEHSIFALPFALVSTFVAAQGFPELLVLVLILVCMVLARSAAMAFNRFIDAEIDAKNPRTASRSIPAGRLSRGYTLGFTLVSSLLFVGTTWFFNPLAFYLSPLILVVLLGYSITKRFTSYCHFVLGLALGLSPLGAWIAVKGSFDWLPILLGLAVMCWVAGFDIIYAAQDIDFDRKENLHSIPARLGVNRSLILSRFLHLIMVSLIILIGLKLELGIIYWVGTFLVAGCLVYEHSLVWDGNLDKVNMAFFTINGVVSLIFGATTIGSILL